MPKSFFEKLTGASNEDEEETENEIEEEEIEVPKEEKKPAKTPIKSGKQKAGKKIVKKTKPPKTIKKIEPEEEIEDKEWLEEAEGEEGQLTIDVYQTDSDVVIKSTIAGVKPENIDISITNDMVTIKGKRTKEEKIEAENYYYQELYWGAFSRSVILPVEVDSDKAKASIKNGILTIKLPKSEKIKTKKIQVLTTE
jgi:HSP20 family protein